MVEKLTFNSLTTTLMDIPAVSMPIACSLKTVALGCVTKLNILEWPFIVPSTRCICVIIMMFISFLICHTCQVDGLSWQRRNAH